MAGAGLVTGQGKTNAVVQIQSGMQIEPVVLIDQNGNYVTIGGTATALATTTGGVNVGNATTPTVGEVLTATSGTTATWQTASAFLCVPSMYAPASAPVDIATNSSTMASLNGTATTVASGSNGGTISTIASWGATFGGNGVLDVANTSGWPTAGTANVAASGATTAVITYTATTGTSLTGCVYVSGSPAPDTVSTGGAVTLTNPIPTISTGNFTAGTSGSVVVEASFVAQTSAGGNKVAFGLAATGTLTPMVAPVWTFIMANTTNLIQMRPRFYVTGLTAGSAYSFDLLACSASGTTLTVFAYGGTATTLGNGGAPVLLTVQGI
jgi:hypothetical protein